MSVDFEAPQFSDKLTAVLSGQLNTGTPQWVLDKTKGMKFADGENVLFLTGLLPKSSVRSKKKSFVRSESFSGGDLFWEPTPEDSKPQSRGRSRTPNLFNRNDYFGYIPPPTPSGSVSVNNYSPKAGKRSAEYEQYVSNNNEKWHKCMSDRLFAETVRRPQLYPIHAGLNGESMHSFIVGSKYNRKNYLSPTHLQLFDYYSPPAKPSHIEHKYRSLRKKSSTCRVVSSETELTSRLKSPLPREAFDTCPTPRPPSTTPSSTSCSPRRPATHLDSSNKHAQRSLRRLNSAPSYRQISHLQGFTKEVFEKALHRRGVHKHSHAASRPQTASSGKSVGDCVICKSPEVWKAFVESQKGELKDDHNNLGDPTDNQPATSDFGAQSNTEHALEAREKDEKAEEKEKDKEERPEEIGIRIFATEPPLDDEEEQPGVTGVEIVVRERPLSPSGVNVLNTEIVNDVTLEEPEAGTIPLEERDEVFKTQHLSSPAPELND